MLSGLDGLGWLLLLLGPLIFVQRALHKELQTLFLLMTHRVEIALVMFSILFLPGVIIHELSHYLMAVILRIRTGKLSLLPQNKGNGRLQMGYIETEKVDFIRDAFVGVAPLVAGGFIVSYIGKFQLGFLILWDALATLELSRILDTLQMNLNRPDFWVWFYLMVVVSSTMLPSSSDRRAWMPLSLMVVVSISIGFIIGVGPWMMEQIENRVAEMFRSLAIVFGMSASVHLAVLIPAWVVRKVLTKITGYQVRTTA